MSQDPLILLAEDDEHLRKMLSVGLTEAGYQVTQASDGEQAISLCHEFDHDLAIFDVNLPGISGIDAATTIGKETKVPFIIISAIDDADVVNDAVERGALGYLVKPLDINTLLPVVSTALKRAEDIKDLECQKTNLNVALQTSRETSQAIGILMERHRLTQDQAFDMLRQHSRSQRRQISEVAGEIVDAMDRVNSLSAKNIK